MEEKEFRAKVMPLYPRMYALALRLGLPPDDASDIVQETLISLWRGREGIPESPAELTAYCITALRNGTLRRLKHRSPTVPIEMALNEVSELKAPTVEENDTRNRVENLIENLPRGQQQIIRMSLFAEMEIPEIAQETGYTRDNVRQLLSRGRKRLRELLLRKTE